MFLLLPMIFFISNVDEFTLLFISITKSCNQKEVGFLSRTETELYNILSATYKKIQVNL